jgi:heptosyltransferase III
MNALMNRARNADTLAIHPGALGDVLLAVPALRALRAAFPGDALGLVAQPRIAGLLAALGVVDTPIAFDALRLDALFAEDADGVSGACPADDADGSRRVPDPRLARAVRVACWFGAGDPGFRRGLLAITSGAVIAPSIPPGGGLVWEHLVRTVARWVSGPAALHPIAVPPTLLAEGLRCLRDAGWDGTTPLLMVHPGAGSVSKCWPAAAFARVLEEVTSRDAVALVVHEGPADAEACAELFAGLRCPALRLWQPELSVLAGALAHCALYLGNDSGVSHLAAAVGTTAVVLFTPAMLDWRPWVSSGAIVVTCAAIEPAQVDAVVAAVRSALAGSSPTASMSGC